jgi:hypothetical protein
VYHNNCETSLGYFPPTPAGRTAVTKAVAEFFAASPDERRSIWARGKRYRKQYPRERFSAMRVYGGAA